MLAELQGQIERITYTNEENGFTIAKVKVPGRQDLVCAVENLMAPMPGEIINRREEQNPVRGSGFFSKKAYGSNLPITPRGGQNESFRICEVQWEGAG